MSNIIPFESAALPAHIKADKSTGNEFGFSGGPSIATISIKGKNFHTVDGGVRTLVMAPGTDDTPAASLEVVILNSGPKGGLYQKTFYSTGYVEGSNAKPSCHSVDGVSPAVDAQDKQSTKCALCPMNAKGSGATQQNPNGKACKSSKVLAVAPAGDLSKPMLMRVPGDSTLALRDFGEKIAIRGVKAHQVITKIGFDASKAFPSLTFKPVGFTSDDMHAQVMKLRESTLVKVIIGEAPMSALVAEDDEEFVSDPAPEVMKQVAAPKKAAAKPAPAPVAEGDDDLPTTKKAEVPVEPETKPAAAPKKAAVVVEEPAEGLEAALSNINFDD